MSRLFIWKYLCWCRAEPTFLLNTNGTTETKLKGKPKKIAPNPVPREPTKPNEVPRSHRIESGSKQQGLPVLVTANDHNDTESSGDKPMPRTVTPLDSPITPATIDMDLPKTELNPTNLSTVTDIESEDTEPPQSPNKLDYHATDAQQSNSSSSSSSTTSASSESSQ